MRGFDRDREMSVLCRTTEKALFVRSVLLFSSKADHCPVRVQPIVAVYNPHDQTNSRSMLEVALGIPLLETETADLIPLCDRENSRTKSFPPGKQPATKRLADKGRQKYTLISRESCRSRAALEVCRQSGLSGNLFSAVHPTSVINSCI
jgi:hypothetical protein